MVLSTCRCRRARLLAPFFVALTGLMFLGVATAAAQPFDFLMDPLPDISGSPPPGVAAVFEITLNLDGLELAPDEVRIVLPAPDGEIIAAKRAFDPIDGFDSNGVPTKNFDEVRYVWRGQAGDWDVVLAVAYGVPSGTILGVANHYKVHTPSVPPKLYEMGQPLVDMEPPFDITPFEVASAASPEALPLAVNLVWINPVAADPAVVTIDILSLFTEQARLDTGNNPGDTSDITHLLPTIDETYALINHALENSLSMTRVRVAGIARVTGFTPSSDVRGDLALLSQDASVKSLRNIVGGDDISIIIRDSDDPFITYCGYSITQRKDCWDTGGPTAGCDVGQSFSEFAVHVATVDCVAMYLAGPHEFSHNMGGEHTYPEVSYWVPRENASFPFSYAYTTPLYSTLTVRSPPDIRVLYYSNPEVTYAGYSTGIPAEASISLTIDTLGPIVASFRPPNPSLIFDDDFETGDLSIWISLGAVVGGM